MATATRISDGLSKKRLNPAQSRRSQSPSLGFPPRGRLTQGQQAAGQIQHPDCTYSGQEHPSTQASQGQAGPKDRRNLPYPL
jgi:hypothetical protein